MPGRGRFRLPGEASQYRATLGRTSNVAAPLMTKLMPHQERLNILLVDDQPSKILTYEAMLNELGENLLRAGSGRDALEHLLKSDVAVILLDVCMPDLDGF